MASLTVPPAVQAFELSGSVVITLGRGGVLLRLNDAAEKLPYLFVAEGEAANYFTHAGCA
jgi:hypothetical protein